MFVIDLNKSAHQGVYNYFLSSSLGENLRSCKLGEKNQEIDVRSLLIHLPSIFFQTTVINVSTPHPCLIRQTHGAFLFFKRPGAIYYCG